MRNHHRRYWSALTGTSDTTPRNLGEVLELQRRAWDEHCLLVLSPDDERLDDEDRSDLHRIGDRLFRVRKSLRLPGL
jgi:hypothetical protein